MGEELTYFSMAENDYQYLVEDVGSSGTHQSVCDCLHEVQESLEKCVIAWNRLERQGKSGFDFALCRPCALLIK